MNGDFECSINCNNVTKYRAVGCML